MTIDADTFLTSVYVTVDTFCAKHPTPLRRGPRPRMSDSEVLTLMLLKQWHGTSERGMLAWIAQTYHGYFPIMLTPSAFNRRARALASQMVQLMHELARQLAVWEEAYEILDGLPVPVARVARGQRRKCFLPEVATIGYGGTGKIAYYGVSMVLCVTGSGVITGFVTAPANNAERWEASDLLCWRADPTARPLDIDAITNAHHHGRRLVGPIGHHLSPATAGQAVTDWYLADRGFAGREWQQIWQTTCHATVITPDRLSPRIRHWFHHARQRIETVNAALTDVLHIKFPRARTEEGLMTRLVSACTALNLGILLNRQFHRRDLAVGTLFRG